MKRIITSDDIIDILLKGKQRGFNFIFSKFTFSRNKRTESAFNETAEYSSNWWTIPYIHERWNNMITDSPTTNYIDYFVHNVLNKKKDLKMLSLGSGDCKTELELATYKIFSEITCVDLSEYRLKLAAQNAKNERLYNIKFINDDINNLNIKEKYDIVLFIASLHHFNNVKSLIGEKIVKWLKDDGLLVINEYVGPNRLQFPRKQIKEINNAINTIPKSYRKRYKSNFYKKSFSGYGLLRMIIADPSECIDSRSILPTIHKYFTEIIEKPYGGNILMNVLKDISHHFIDLNQEKKNILDNLFNIEDKYLEKEPSDFIFGVYKKKELK